ncbi:MAG: DNA gyrase inhibitor YacG [Gammaproteobacteria bacterium]|nr:DNA gyrase inhibitor YacG [Gammaproteobacteria bacterium]MBQ0838298.1 DNA gyrase inhibitor YacG [Gammaproteobacteria bacterium]
MSDKTASTKSGSSNSTSNIVLQCPQCKKPVHWNENYPNRPFCSKRCQQLDFGEWATEQNTIAGDSALADSEDWQDD